MTNVKPTLLKISFQYLFINKNEVTLNAKNFLEEMTWLGNNVVETEFDEVLNRMGGVKMQKTFSFAHLEVNALDFI